jgi:hypothetical protein
MWMWNGWPSKPETTRQCSTSPFLSTRSYGYLERSALSKFFALMLWSSNPHSSRLSVL